jgi:hypothetical protein
VLELIHLSMTLLALAGYGIVLHRLRRRGARWPVTRVAAMLAGSLCAAAAVLPPIASHDELFPVHVACPPREAFCDRETGHCVAPTQMGAKWGAIIGRHQATSGRLKRSIPEIEQV